MGAAKYYPISRVKTNLYTNGGAYYLNGQPYRGAYYLTFKGEAYTGADPLFGDNELLSTKPNTGTYKLTGSPLLDRYNKSLSDQNKQVGTEYEDTKTQSLKQIAPYYPSPTDTDYARGYFTRYFAKRIVDSGYVVEISLQDYTSIEEKDDQSYEAYEIESMLWQLTGPLKDTRVSQYQVKGGVFDTNKRVTEGKAKNFIGLLEFIGGDYTKFARITG
jgi:hypothetical protein